MTWEVSTSACSDLHALVREWCRAHQQAGNLEQAERFAIQVGQLAAECAFECAVEACGTKAGYCGASLPCHCGQRARFVGYRCRWVRGQPGEVGVSRAYYHCRWCGAGQCPWDREQGLDLGSLTPFLKTRVAQLCGRLVFREAAEVLEQFTGLSLAVSMLEEVTEQVGARLRGVESERVRLLFEKNVLPPADPLLAEVVGKRAYLCVDAAKAHTDGGWHDIKVAAFFPGVAPGGPQAQWQGWDEAGPTRYLATQEEAEAFGRRLYLFALRLGCERAQELVLLGDGAEWIWKLAALHFSDAVQILDFFHASEHVWKIARAAFGEGSPEGKQWAQTCSEQLQEQGVRGLLCSLRELRGQKLSETARAEIVGEVQYFRRNRKRIDYPRYRAAGMMIGSGPVEAACKSVVGGRLKGTGMRWSRTGADAVLAVRCAVLGGTQAELAACARAA
jgi:hypothetical protein